MNELELLEKYLMKMDMKPKLLEALKLQDDLQQFVFLIWDEG